MERIGEFESDKIHILPLLLTSCVMSGELLNLSEPQLPCLWSRDNYPHPQCCRHSWLCVLPSLPSLGPFHHLEIPSGPSPTGPPGIRRQSGD